MSVRVLTFLAIAAMAGCDGKFGAEGDSASIAIGDSGVNSDLDSDADTDADTDADADADNTDDDGDGWTENEDDCDDDDPDVNPGADEVCNSIDDNCDGRIDEDFPTSMWYEDYDEDGFGDPDVDEASCDQPEGYVANDLDCDDLDDDVYPGADEDTDDGEDSNCDGYDTSFEECSQDAVEAAMDDWVDGWTYSVSDYDCGTFLYGCLVEDQWMYVDVVDSEVSPTEDPLTFDVVISAQLDVVGYVETSGLIGENNCDMDASGIDVVYTGTLSLDIESDGEVDPNPNITGTLLDTPSMFVDFTDTPGGEGCDLEILDLLASFAGFDLTGFVDDAAAEAVDDLADDIEDEIEWQYEWGGHCPGE